MANWSNLSKELKSIVVSHLNFPTRKSLRKCSKLSRELVENVPIDVPFLQFKQDKSKSVLTIQFDEDTKFEIVFTKSEQGTEVTRISKPKKPIFNPEMDTDKVAIDFLTANFKNAKFKFVMLELRNSYHPVNILPNSINSDQLYIYSAILTVGIEWLSKFKPNLEILEFHTDDDPQGIYDLPQVQTCTKTLVIHKDCGINDSQLLNLKVWKYLEIHSTKITEIGLNSFLKKCLISNSNLKFQIKIGNIHNNSGMMLNGLEFETKNLVAHKKRPKGFETHENREFIIINGKIAIRIMDDTTIFGDCGAGNSEPKMLNIGELMWNKQPEAKKNTYFFHK